jgi:hypothetical protein
MCLLLRLRNHYPQVRIRTPFFFSFLPWSVVGSLVLIALGRRGMFIKASGLLVQQVEGWCQIRTETTEGILVITHVLSVLGFLCMGSAINMLRILKFSNFGPWAFYFPLKNIFKKKLYNGIARYKVYVVVF